MLSSIKLLGFLSTLLAISAYKCGGYPTASSGVIGHRRRLVELGLGWDSSSHHVGKGAFSLAELAHAHIKQQGGDDYKQ